VFPGVVSIFMAGMFGVVSELVVVVAAGLDFRFGLGLKLGTG
jgi:hypothetical protein